MKKNLLTDPVQVINVGLEKFALDLKERGTPVVHVTWSPPAGGNKRLLELLAKIGD